MTDHFNFTHFRKTFYTVFAIRRAQSRGTIRLRHIERRKIESALARRGFFKDQSFILVGVSRSLMKFFGELLAFVSLVQWVSCSRKKKYQTGCCKALPIAAAKRSISWRVVV